LLGKQRKEFAVGESPQRAERAGASESKGRMKTGTKNVSATCFRHLVHPPSRHGGTTEDGPEDPLSSSRAGAPREHEQSNYPKIHSSSRPSRRQARSPAVKPSQVHKKNPQSSLAGIWISDFRLPTSDLRLPTSANPAFHPIPTYSGGGAQAAYIPRCLNNSCSFVSIRGSPPPQHKKITKRTHFQKIALPANKGDSAHCVSNLDEKRTHFYEPWFNLEFH